MSDDHLTPNEQADFARLPREISPPAALEDRVVATLTHVGAIRPRRPGWAMRAAAGFLLVAAAFAAGRLASSSNPVADGERYLLLLYGTDVASPSEEQARVTEYAAWATVQQQAGHLIDAAKLEDDARSFGPAAAAPTTAGEPRGYFLIRATTEQEAAAIAATSPHLHYGGTVVLRKVARTN